ncbi:MAG: NADH-quinone oxidoreductase subunit G [Thiotrichales bacterium]|jgi:NADH-quinone oxidoreductase subunit G|nr:NADH-quinone oxidoreductase subunit G [Thiotrichales bacterium]
MVKIEINGQSIRAREGSMLIDVADDAGIAIPRFCYHKKLSVAANCRMCLVEVAGAPKTLPACATPVTDGMKVMTKSPKALAAQKSVMEFLLINHPLDCPICDQGGECELQDVSMLYGQDISRFNEGKRIVGDRDIGSLVQTDMTRCIHCTRCVRFGKEVAGIMELGATGRGEHMEIGTYVAKAMVSELSGNIIDLCPVGALTSKPYRYTARAWELQATPSIAIHDGLGSHTFIHHKQGEVKRVVPRENEAINEVWLSDRDRFSYTGLTQNRLTHPMRKVDGVWHQVDWESALTEIAALLNGQLSQDANSFGALISPTATAEEMYLLQKLLKAKGCYNIDHRLHQQDFSADAANVMPYLPMPIEQVEKVKAALLIGSFLRHEQPLLNQRLRKATQMRAKIMAINPVDFDFNYRLSAKSIVSMQDMTKVLAGLARTLAGEQALSANESALLVDVVVDANVQKMAEQLRVDGDKLIILGQIAQSHPAFGRLMQLASLVARLSGAQLTWLPEAGNSLGACLVGAQAEGTALNAAQMLKQGMKNWLLWGVDPAKDALLPEAHALSGRVIAVSAIDTPELRAVSDWLLPIAAFGEAAGSYINANATWQFATVALHSPGEAKPGWKVLRVLGNLMGLSGFEFVSIDEVTQEAKATAKVVQADMHQALMDITTPVAAFNGLARVAQLPMYASDMIVRNALPLQQHEHAGQALLRANPEDVSATQTEISLLLPDGSKQVYAVVADVRVARGNIVAPISLLPGLPADSFVFAA